MEPGGALYEDLPNYNPVALLCEALGENASLQEVRLACSCVDYTADCALAHSLTLNKTLVNLDLSGNPHGNDGVRTIIRLIVTPGISVDHCSINEFRDAGRGPGAVRIDLGAPSGEYSLEFRHPQHRAGVRLLLQKAEADGVRPPQQAFHKVSFSGPKGAWAWQKPDKSWDCPRSGRLCFQYLSKTDVDVKLSASAHVHKWLCTRRTPLTLSRFVIILGMLKTLTTREQKIVFVQAIGDCLLLKTCHLKKLLEICPNIALHIMNTLYPHLSDGGLLALDQVKLTREDSFAFRHQACDAIFFNLANATNRYSLVLMKPMDRSVAERLQVIDSFEMKVSRWKESVDTSQHGNRDNARNVRCDKRTPKNFIDFPLPEVGHLTLDYVSPMCFCPKRKATPTTEELVAEIADTFYFSKVGPHDKVMALRFISTELVLTKMQIVEILKTFPNPLAKKCRSMRRNALNDSRTLNDDEQEQQVVRQSAFGLELPNPRIAAFVLLFNRCCDPPTLCTETCLLDRSLFSVACAKELQDRLGWQRTFDARYCHTPMRGKSSNIGKVVREIGMASTDSRSLNIINAARTTKSGDAELGRRYDFNLGIWEQWICARFIVLTAGIEEGIHLVRASWSERSILEAQGYDFLVPSFWHKEHGRDIPRQGTFHCTFMVEREEYVDLKARHSLAEELFGWEVFYF